VLFFSFSSRCVFLSSPSDRVLKALGTRHEGTPTLGKTRFWVLVSSPGEQTPKSGFFKLLAQLPMASAPLRNAPSPAHGHPDAGRSSGHVRGCIKMPYGEVSGGVDGASPPKSGPGHFSPKPGFPDPRGGGGQKGPFWEGGVGGVKMCTFSGNPGPPRGGWARTRFGGHFCHLLEIVRLASAEPFPKDAQMIADCIRQLPQMRRDTSRVRGVGGSTSNKR
jgi:hypothetical protein